VFLGGNNQWLVVGAREMLDEKDAKTQRKRGTFEKEKKKKKNSKCSPCPGRKNLERGVEKWGCAAHQTWGPGLSRGEKDSQRQAARE